MLRNGSNRLCRADARSKPGSEGTEGLPCSVLYRLAQGASGMKSSIRQNVLPRANPLSRPAHLLLFMPGRCAVVELMPQPSGQLDDWRDDEPVDGSLEFRGTAHADSRHASGQYRQQYQSSEIEQGEHQLSHVPPPVSREGV